MAHWKLVIPLSSIVMLCGCALFPSNFDNQEHARLVTISHMTLNTEVCEDLNNTKNMVQTIKHHVGWLKIYSGPLPNNAKMASMVGNLDNMVSGFEARYNDSSTTPSKFYCEQKVKLINEATNEIITVSARRPR